MLFNSFPFLILLIITFILYYLPVFKKHQIWIVTISSFIFYAYHLPVLLFLFSVSVILNSVASYGVFNSPAPAHKRAFATFGVVLNLAILAFFKYSPLVAHTFWGNSPAPNSIGHFLLTIPLPIGISFYTFHGISLVIDTFKGLHDGTARSLVKPNKVEHVLNTAFFLSFFPQLIAGPIMKAHELVPQITAKYFENINWKTVFKALVIGYFLKMVVADNLKEHTYWLAYPYILNFSSTMLLTLLLGYTAQIFADFAGYSLIALGLAEMFGYKLMQNFNFPYISRSFSEFWRRWHISLSSWLRDYLYIPLGGNRHGETRTYFNLMATMFLGGLWHGAAWSYAVWGTWHGVALAIERFLQSKFKIKNNTFNAIWQTLLVFIFVAMAWLLFKLPDFSHVIIYCKSLFTNINSGIGINRNFVYIMIYSLPVWAYHAHYLLQQSSNASYQRFTRYFEPYIYAILIFFILVNSGSAGEFIYFQF